MRKFSEKTELRKWNREKFCKKKTALKISAVKQYKKNYCLTNLKLHAPLKVPTPTEQVIFKSIVPIHEKTRPELPVAKQAP